MTSQIFSIFMIGKNYFCFIGSKDTKLTRSQIDTNSWMMLPLYYKNYFFKD